MYPEEGYYEGEGDEGVYDEDGKLTPLGLAMWADEEGGWEGLLEGKGREPFLEAGVDPDTLEEYEIASREMEKELKRIGAWL